MKLEVDFQKPIPAAEKPETTEKPTPGSDEKKSQAPEKSAEEKALEAMQRHERVRAWTYQIATWQHKAFITNVEGLLEQKEKKENE
jgi:hypothetical protein